MFRVLFLTYLLFSSIGFSLEYEAKLEGDSPPEIRKEVLKASSLLSRKQNPPTYAALERQIEQDAEQMVNRAKSFGFLDAKVTASSTLTPNNSSLIRFHLILGDRYRLGAIGFFVKDPHHILTTPPSEKDIPSFHKEALVEGESLLSFQKELLSSLASRGYPKAQILEVIYTPEVSQKQLNIFYTMELGSYTTFGPISIQGNRKIKSGFILSQIPFKEGDEFNKTLLDTTEQKLLQSGVLLSSSFESQGEPLSNGEQPLTLHVEEGKLHAIGGGLSYMTTLGFGLSGLYEDRYMGRKGEKLNCRLDVFQRKQQGVITLTRPNFRLPQQNLLWILEYDAQTYLPYHSKAAKFSCMLERTWSPQVETVFGGRIECLRTNRFSDRKNELLKAPFQIKLSNTDSLLDPTRGALLNIHLTPSMQYVRPMFSYLINLCSLSLYISSPEKTLTGAWKGTFGNILGTRPHKIPYPDRFFGGSDSMMRGYKPGTVSPRNKKGEFIGGDSLLANSFEVRIRAKKNLGWVLFYDMGNVYKHRAPQKQLHFLNSVGGGIRYSTPIGPLRLDIAFPLNRRHKIDPLFQLYFSIGQAF